MDLQLFNLINQYAGKYEWLDKFAIFFAEQAILVMAIMVAFLWFMDSGLARTKNQYAVVMAFEAILLARGVITTLMHYFIDRARPFVDNAVTLLIDQNPLGAGLPSGHTVMAFSLSLPVFMYNKVAGSWLLFASFLIALSRVFVGVHYPSDLLVGFAVAVVVVLFLNFFRGVFVAPVVTYRMTSQNSRARTMR